MWKKEITIKTQATKEQVWKLWSNVTEWNTWDTEVQHAEIKGEFKEGIKGTLKPTKGPKSTFILKNVNYPITFTTASKLPFAQMDFTHKLTETKGVVSITHGVEIRGFTTFIFSKLIGEKIITELPKAIENLSKMAKNA